MIKFLSILSILIYTSYSQTCANSHAQSTFFSVSINGQSINQIGVQAYIDTIKLAAEAILPQSGTQNVGLLSFGGTTLEGVPVDDFFMEQTMTTGDYSTIETKLTNLATTRAFDANYGNSVRAAVSQAIGQSWNGQKYHVLFAAGNPLANNVGSGTNPENVDKICSKAIEAKQNNIQTYVALIGADGINFIKEFYTCLVEDPATDIIVIDPTSSTDGINALFQRVCKTGGIDFKITEVNPVAGNYRRYIEVLNRGKPIKLSTCFGLNMNTCTWSNEATTATATGAYYIGSGGAGTNPSGAQGGLAASAGNEGWQANAREFGVTGELTNSVKHESANGFQNQITAATSGSPERSFALRAVGFNNQYGLNWRMSCGSSGGTPGIDPLTECVSISPASGTCEITATCGESGTGTCLDNNNYCLCDDAFWSDADTCISEPTAVGTCKGYTIRDAITNRDWTYFVFSLEYDGLVEFSIQYQKTGGNDAIAPVTDVSVASADSIRPVDLTDGTADIVVTTTLTPPLGVKTAETIENLACTVDTLEPTISPTTDPTVSPAKTPTTSPTSNPTYDAPGVFFANSGFCKGDRCNCGEQGRDCCIPFGPRYGDTMTSGSVAPNGCNNIFKDFEVTPDHGDKLQEELFITKYGEPVATTVFYRMTALGQINQTEFSNLTLWTNYYDPSTWARRRLGEDLYDLENDNLGTRRSLLQTTTTPAPTTEYGNKLNIEVSPPGHLNVYTGSVIIPDGSTTTNLPINISVATIKCARGQDCTTYDECIASSMAFQLLLLNCTSAGSSSCQALYPTTIWISVKRDNKLCSIIFGRAGGEDELPDWFWWVLIALIIFLLILAWLVYRFWWKQKKTASELGDAEDELDQQQADNEAGFGKDLDVGDVAFNPMATGVPGMNRPADAFGNELHQRQLEQQNDMVDVQAEIFQVRQDYGQVATQQRHQGH
eukprot:939477_1